MPLNTSLQAHYEHIYMINIAYFAELHKVASRGRTTTQVTWQLIDVATH